MAMKVAGSDCGHKGGSILPQVLRGSLQHLQPYRMILSQVGQQSILSNYFINHLHTQHHRAGVVSHTSFSTLT
jgi:hypothetical protein